MNITFRFFSYSVLCQSKKSQKVSEALIRDQNNNLL